MPAEAKGRAEDKEVQAKEGGQGARAGAWEDGRRVVCLWCALWRDEQQTLGMAALVGGLVLRAPLGPALAAQGMTGRDAR